MPISVKARGLVPAGKVVRAIVVGMKKADGDYKKLSGLSIGEAPEYFLTTRIAQEVRKLDVWVDLERSVSLTLKEAGAIASGPIPKVIRGNGRFDLVVHKQNEKPRFIVEVKHLVSSFHRIEKDVERISAVLARGRNGNSFQFGIIALYAQKKVLHSAQEKLALLLEELSTRCGEFVKNKRQTVEVERDLLSNGPTLATAAVCVLIRKAPGSAKKSMPVVK